MLEGVLSKTTGMKVDMPSKGVSKNAAPMSYSNVLRVRYSLSAQISSAVRDPKGRVTAPPGVSCLWPGVMRKPNPHSRVGML